MTLRTRVLLWLLPAMVVLAVGQFWLLSKFTTRDSRATNTAAFATQNSDNPAGQLATPIPSREYNNSLPVPSARVTPDMIQTVPKPVQPKQIQQKPAEKELHLFPNPRRFTGQVT